METKDKIRFMREAKHWSQEEMAKKLNMSTYGYAKIERGETQINMPKLEKIAEVLGVDLMELLAFGEKNILCVIGDNNQNGNGNYILICSTTELAFEIQKLQLITEHQQSIIAHKDKEIARLEEILAMQKRLNTNIDM